MRWLFVLALACGGGKGGGLDGGVADNDAVGATCAPGGACEVGPTCGSGCCGPGERCFNDTCLCGTSKACTAGDSCQAAGPIGGDACGSICCGATGPCPQ